MFVFSGDFWKRRKSIDDRKKSLAAESSAKQAPSPAARRPLRSRATTIGNMLSRTPTNHFAIPDEPTHGSPPRRSVSVSASSLRRNVSVKLRNVNQPVRRFLSHQRSSIRNPLMHGSDDDWSAGSSRVPARSYEDVKADRPPEFGW